MPEQKDIAAGGVFNFVRVNVVRIPSDADFSVFYEPLLEDPIRTARYQILWSQHPNRQKRSVWWAIEWQVIKEVAARSHLPSTAKPVSFRVLVSWKD